MARRFLVNEKGISTLKLALLIAAVAVAAVAVKYFPQVIASLQRLGAWLGVGAFL